MFDKDTYVQCFNLKDESDVKTFVKMMSYELKDEEEGEAAVAGMIDLIREEGLFDSTEVWYAGMDVATPTRPVILSHMSIISNIGDNLSNTDIPVFIEQGTGNVFCRPESIY